MKISQLSKTTNVSARSIRHYEKKKLIKARRLDNDYREFDESAVKRIGSIQTFLGFGLTTDEIQKVLACSDDFTDMGGFCEDMLKTYESKLEQVNNEMDTLAALQSRLEKQIRIMKKKRDRLVAKS